MSEQQSSCVALPVEYWPVPGFTGYRAGSDGTIWSCLKPAGDRWHGNQRQEPIGEWKQLKPDCRKEDNRKRYTLRRDDGRLIRRYGSHFVLLAFVGPNPGKLEACHDNGDCTNDASDNLYWGTSIQNKSDMKRHGTQPCGESHSKAKIRDSDIPVILARRGEPLKAIAGDYGVSPQRISQIHKKGSR